MGKKKSRPWGGPEVTVFCLIVFAVIAGVASGQANPDDLPTGLRLDSGWIFHFAFGLVLFLIIYVIAALITFTVTSGAPLTKIGLGQFSFEGPAAETLVEGAASLKGINDELNALNKTADSLVSIATEGAEAFSLLLEEHPDLDSSVKSGSEQRIKQLQSLALSDKESRQRTAEAVRRFETKFAALEEFFNETEADNG